MATFPSPTLQNLTVEGAATVTDTIAASNFSGSSSGTNTGDQTITLTGDVTGSGTGSFATAAASTIARYAILAAVDGINGSNLVGFLQSGTGAVGRTVQAKIQDGVSVKDFGAKGDGATDDTAAINAAETAVNAAGGGVLIFPDGGVYMVNNLGLTKKSSVDWAMGGATIKALAQTFTAPVGLVNGNTLSNFRIRDGILDTSQMVVSGLVSTISLENCSNYAIEGCQLTGVQVFGISHNGGSQFTIKDNIITKAAAANTQNQGILISVAAAISTNGLIQGNVLSNTGMDISASFTIIDGNNISGWMFGGGITTEISAHCSFLTITNNICINGTGTDVNSTDCEGIENWAPYSLIRGNLCKNNSGDGIAQGGSFSVCLGNICLNNGQTSGNGMTARYQTGSPTIGANHSSFVDNLCADTQATPTQLYGYADQSSSELNYIKVSNNLFTGNKTAPMSAITSLMDFTGPHIHFTAAWTPGTIAIGGIVDLTITAPGAALGDVVTAALNADTQSCTFTAWVTATNAVKVQLYNSSGVSVTFGALTIYGYISKMLNYSNY